MARRAKPPTVLDQAEAIHERRMALALKRHAVDDVERAASAVVDGAGERRRAVLLAEARGDEPTETVEQVDRERRAAEVAIADARERSAALKTVEDELGEETDALIDRNPDHYRDEAVRASEDAEAALRAALDAAQAAKTAWMAAYSAWGTVRKSCKRREVDPPPGIPINDIGGPIHELTTEHHRTWPGGSRVTWERFCEREGTLTAAPPSVRQVRAAEPLIELIGSDAA